MRKRTEVLDLGKSHDSFNITDRGTVYVFNPLPNGLTVGDIRELMNKLVIINDTSFWVKGVESFAMGEPMRSKLPVCGILVEPVEDERLIQALRGGLRKGKTTFDGIWFCRKDGSKEFVKPNPALKKNIEEYLNM